MAILSHKMLSKLGLSSSFSHKHHDMTVLNWPKTKINTGTILKNIVIKNAIDEDCVWEGKRVKYVIINDQIQIKQNHVLINYTYIGSIVLEHNNTCTCR
jgi:hypothetical protein